MLSPEAILKLKQRENREAAMRFLNTLRLGLALATSFAFLVVTPAMAGQPPAPPAGWSDGYVMANGIRIHYWRTGGDKAVLLMAHGFSDDGLCWTDLAKELVGDYDIIMPDARGHGLSDPPSPSDPIDVQVEDLAGLIRELKLEKPILMGHSMGSSSAAWFAARYPDIPRAVVLEDPRLIPRTPKPAAQDGEAKRRGQILARNNMTYAELLADCLRNNPQWSQTEVEFWARSKRLYHPNLAYRSTGERPAMSDLFLKITAPTLILKADAELAHQAGARLGYIITSSCMPLLELFAEAGVDALIGVDPAAWGLTVAKEKLGGKVCLWGGVNGHLTVEHGTTEEVRAEVCRAMEIIAPGGGFILSPVDNVRENTTQACENVMALIDEWQRLTGQ